MSLVAIDPGTVSLGWAEFRESRLVACGAFGRKTRTIPEFCAEISTAIPTARVVALEWMQAAQRVPPQDLIDVSLVGAYAAACAGGSLVLYHPVDWKGSVPKAIHHPRILSALTEPERAIADASCSRAGRFSKEVLDAIGIGLYHLRRTNKGGSRVTTP